MPRDCGVPGHELRELWEEEELLRVAEELLWLRPPDRQLPLEVGVEVPQRRESKSDDEEDSESLQRC